MRSLFVSYDGSAPTLEDWRRFFTVRLRARRWAKIARDRKRWRASQAGRAQEALIRSQRRAEERAIIDRAMSGNFQAALQSLEAQAAQASYINYQAQQSRRKPPWSRIT